MDQAILWVWTTRSNTTDLLWSKSQTPKLGKCPTGWWFEPLWKIWKSIGMIIPNIWENKTCSKPPTSQVWHMLWIDLNLCHSNNQHHAEDDEWSTYFLLGQGYPQIRNVGPSLVWFPQFENRLWGIHWKSQVKNSFNNSRNLQGWFIPKPCTNAYHAGYFGMVSLTIRLYRHHMGGFLK